MENVDPSWKKDKKNLAEYTEAKKKKKLQQVFAKASYELLKIFCSDKGTSYRERDYNVFTYILWLVCPVAISIVR
jgi:hypothetical protein